MAKDGTNRGGARPGAGRKKKPLNEKINEGKADKAQVLKIDTDLVGEDIPPMRDYLKAKQKIGIDLCAEDVYIKTHQWLQKTGCEMLVNNQLVENYAMSVARYIQCEIAISEFGFLSKHPTTGAAIASPYVSMSQNYLKQVNQTWMQIYQVVKDNCSGDYGASPQDDLMERLLSGRKN